jgi:predicted Zn-dependent protease
LREAEAAIETQGFDPKLTQDYVERVHDQGRESGHTWYLKGYTQWRLGQRDDAKKSLKRAIALSPGSLNYAQLMVQLNQPNADENTFHGYLSFGIDAKDFER